MLNLSRVSKYLMTNLEFLSVWSLTQRVTQSTSACSSVQVHSAHSSGLQSARTRLAGSLFPHTSHNGYPPPLWSLCEYLLKVSARAP